MVHEVESLGVDPALREPLEDGVAGDAEARPQLWALRRVNPTAGVGVVEMIGGGGGVFNLARHR